MIINLWISFIFQCKNPKLITKILKVYIELIVLIEIGTAKMHFYTRSVGKHLPDIIGMR